jgi:hypothetical protein
MLASLSGTLALVVGLAVLLLPLLAREMSRARDSFWGAVVLLLGLTLVTSADRLTGAPMLAVLCGGLLIGRLSSEVLLLRWRQLTPEEKTALGSIERWQTNLSQLAASVAKLISVVAASSGTVLDALQRSSKGKAGSGKRWVRSDAADPHASSPSSGGAGEPEQTLVVSSFDEIDALIQTASGQAG